MTDFIKDAERQHWVYRAPKTWRPYLQLARYDRPIGYWLLTLPGWAGLALAGLIIGYSPAMIVWGALILVGAIAMRGAGCTYNDIIDRDLDAKVERTALRPIPAGTVRLQHAWIWLFSQCAVGLCVWLCLPLQAQIVALVSLPLVAAYPFMKRITWWPQVWLGLTFNWAVLVAFTILIPTFTLPLILFYFGLMFWTVGYDTIYACQDIEDDAFVGIKSTARRFGQHLRSGVTISYALSVTCLIVSVSILSVSIVTAIAAILPFALCLLYQVSALRETDSPLTLKLFKLNRLAGGLLVLGIIVAAVFFTPS